MPEDRDALLQHYRETRRALLDAIEGLSDDALTERTLDGWSVKDHRAHLALWNDLRAAEVARISTGYDSTWRLTREQVAAFNGIATEARWNLSLGQVRWEFATSRQHLLDAIAAVTPRGLDGSLYGEAVLHSGREEEHTEWIARWRRKRGS